MPIETICQSCARKLRVADEHAGKKARCPQCGHIYVVPGESEYLPPGERETVYKPRSESTTWRVRTPDGRVYGPVPKQELDEWVAEGRVTSEAHVQSDDTSLWQPAGEVYPRLAGSREISEASNPFVDRPAPRPVYTQPRHYQRPHRGALILILAIFGWVMCPVFAPFALAMGYSDLRAMRSGDMDPGGMSLTQAGTILGLIETIFLLLCLVLMCFGFAG